MPLARELSAPSGPLAGGSTADMPAFTWETAFTQWIYDPYLAAGIALAAVVYLAGVSRLRQRGVHWPLRRSVAFLGFGLGSITVGTMSSVGAYDATLFSAHVVQHLFLNMIAPVFLALGAPITLALRALPSPGRHRLKDLLHTPVVRALAHPVAGFPLFTSTLFWLYFTPLYEITLRNELVHEWLHFHMLLTGCLFLWPIIRIDPIPGRLPYLGRMAATLLTMPVHIIVGISLMMAADYTGGAGLIARDYYQTLNRDWGPSLVTDQWLGGMILWGAGDFIIILYAAVLIPQWIRSDSRETRRVDRHLDRLEAAGVDTTVPWWLAGTSVAPQPPASGKDPQRAIDAQPQSQQPDNSPAVNGYDLGGVTHAQTASPAVPPSAAGKAAVSDRGSAKGRRRMHHRSLAYPLAAPVTTPLLTAGTPTLATGTGWRGSGLTLLGFLGVFAGIPIGLFALLTLVVVLLSARRRRGSTTSAPILPSASDATGGSRSNPDTAYSSVESTERDNSA